MTLRNPLPMGVVIGALRAHLVGLDRLQHAVGDFALGLDDLDAALLDVPVDFDAGGVDAFAWPRRFPGRPVAGNQRDSYMPPSPRHRAAEAAQGVATVQMLWGEGAEAVGSPAKPFTRGSTIRACFRRRAVKTVCIGRRRRRTLHRGDVADESRRFKEYSQSLTVTPPILAVTVLTDVRDCAARRPTAVALFAARATVYAIRDRSSGNEARSRH